MKVIGEGSVTRLEKKPRSKCRKWKLRVQTDHGEKSKRFEGTYSEAREALKAFIAKLSTPATDVTFREQGADWLLRRKASGNVSDSTAHKYSDDLRVLNAEFGDEKLHEIDRLRAVNGLANIKYNGGKRVKTMSGTYMNQLYVLMKAIMGEAAEDGYIAKNPLEKIEAPKIDTKKRRSLDRETFAGFLVTLGSLPLDSRIVAVYIAVLAGLRRGEVVALRWCDIYDDAIHVRRAYIEKTGRLGKPKTSTGIRDVPMPLQLENILKKWKVIQMEKLALIEVEQTEDTYVAASSTGTLMYPQNLGTWWSEVRGPLFGLEDIKLHELRHTYLTMLATKASSKTLMDLAGWSSIAQADTYVHTDETANREAVSNLGNMIDFETVKIKRAL